mmetsp:Transcript_12447/g.27756  ORF Transcript_12447/g.27756 Transcript_12447/m.27756 type:complete len:117 (-) Transcript_12447:640-990(-)
MHFVSCKRNVLLGSCHTPCYRFGVPSGLGGGFPSLSGQSKRGAGFQNSIVDVCLASTQGDPVLRCHEPTRGNMCLEAVGTRGVLELEADLYQDDIGNQNFGDACQQSSLSHGSILS